MQVVMKAALLSIAAILSAGCQTTLTQAEIKFLETRELDLSYEEAYQAAANGLFSLGYAITHSDKESGILSAQNSRGEAKWSITFLLIIPLPSVGEGTEEETVSLLLTPKSERLTQLRMKLVRDGEPVVDREVMTAIWQRIERAALLEDDRIEQ